MRRLLLAVLCLLLFTLPVWGAEAENTMEVTAVVNGGRLLPDGSEARPGFGRPGSAWCSPWVPEHRTPQ